MAVAMIIIFAVLFMAVYGVAVWLGRPTLTSPREEWDDSTLIHEWKVRVRGDR
jgi:hypothetical protein